MNLCDQHLGRPAQAGSTAWVSIASPRLRYANTASGPRPSEKRRAPAIPASIPIGREHPQSPSSRSSIPNRVWARGPHPHEPEGWLYLALRVLLDPSAP